MVVALEHLLDFGGVQSAGVVALADIYGVFDFAVACLGPLPEFPERGV